jgi:hypothetical protein
MKGFSFFLQQKKISFQRNIRIINVVLEHLFDIFECVKIEMKPNENLFFMNKKTECVNSSNA